MTKLEFCFESGGLGAGFDRLYIRTEDGELWDVRALSHTFHPERRKNLYPSFLTEEICDRIGVVLAKWEEGGIWTFTEA